MLTKRRSDEEEWLSPVSIDSASLQDYLVPLGWPSPIDAPAATPDAAP